MKRSLLALTTLALCFSPRADQNITKAQTRLQAEGFYRGNPSGTYDNETAAAVTRYQIRHGLAITGKLDPATSKELGITAPAAPLRVLSGSWRRLRSGEMEFLEQPSVTPSPNQKHLARTNSAVSPSAPNPPPSTPPAKPPSSAQNPSSSAAANSDDKLSQAMKNYVAAFILAGLDPHIGSELEFFAPNVDYFGARNVPREKIERDLVRYDREWPERRFWLDGEIRVRRRSATFIEFDFPLRYELQNGSKHASGKVIKRLTLFAGAENEMQIVAVNERKAQ